jgi:hypothetical protein
MRSEPTPSERVLCAEISGSKLGVDFRRQVVVAGCIVVSWLPLAGSSWRWMAATTAVQHNGARMRAGIAGCVGKISGEDSSARAIACCACPMNCSLSLLREP